MYIKRQTNFKEYYMVVFSRNLCGAIYLNKAKTSYKKIKSLITRKLGEFDKIKAIKI